MSKKRLLLALAVSVAFNLGVVGATAYRKLQRPDLSSAAATRSAARLPDAQDSDTDLRLLRDRQADLSRRLAELITVGEPDRDAIDRCLDRLASTTRSVHGQVVRTVLAQREMLLEPDRIAFCDQVHRRLCDPWTGCGTTSCNLEDDTRAEAWREKE